SRSRASPYRASATSSATARTRAMMFQLLVAVSVRTANKASAETSDGDFKFLCMWGKLQRRRGDAAGRNREWGGAARVRGDQSNLALERSDGGPDRPAANASAPRGGRPCSQDGGSGRPRCAGDSDCPDQGLGEPDAGFRCVLPPAEGAPPRA